jgi:hypothetical protein
MFTYDSDGGSDNLKIYINGILDAKYTVGSGALQSSGDFWISPYFWPFEGVIDEVRIWDVVLPFNLEFLASSTSVVPINSPATLTAKLTDSDGDPVEGVDITFSSDAPEKLTFAPEYQPTDSNGLAEVQATGTATGVYTVTASAETPLGPVSATWILVVYDPSAGFVTGGGWINSPAGAYAADPTLTGKATFGFVSKYQKGATVPTGNTEFQFHAAGMNFKSTSYQWLVVAGSKAMYKGSGTINGAGDYGFILSAIDGGTKGSDMFRIKIWDKSTGAVVYDNQMGDSETADPTTAIAGGSIVVHSK